MRASFYEPPFNSLITWRFAGDEVRCVYRFNVSFGPTELPELVGRLGQEYLNVDCSDGIGHAG